MKKNPQTKEDTFWIFKDFHGVMRGSKVQLGPPPINFTSGIANPKIIYMLLHFHTLYIDWFFLNAYFDRKFIKF